MVEPSYYGNGINGKLNHSHSAAQSTATVHRSRHIIPRTTVRKTGVDILRDPRYNKGLAFTHAERRKLSLHGLLPPTVLTQEVQVQRVYQRLQGITDTLQKYQELIGLSQRNEKLFYKVVCTHIAEMMPLIYTPVVGAACQSFGQVFRHSNGLYISLEDLGNVSEILLNHPNDNVKAIVFTDGERILGLGDLGTYGMGIPVGKLMLYSACAGVDPQYTLPVCIDVGTNTQSLLDDPLYTGLKQKRERGEKYDALIDEFIKAATERWGENILLQFEDFANSNASRLLQKYKEQACTFNDDIQGTAAVAVAGLFAGVGKIRPYKTLRQHKYLLFGAGSANIGIANLIGMAMQQEDPENPIPFSEALKRIWLVDSKGLVVSSRGDLTGDKKPFAKNHTHHTSLLDIITDLQPTVLIGATAQPNTFDQSIIEAMAKSTPRPIIFALSNPTSKAECTAEQAYEWSNGQALFASGSPFAPVTHNGFTHVPGQGNNSYIFPGVALAIVATQARRVTDQMFLIAAQTLAKLVDKSQLDSGCLYPKLSDIREVSAKIAVAVAEEIYNENLATYQPRPDDMYAFMLNEMYSTDYDNFS